MTSISALSYGHNEPKFSNTAQLVETGANKTIQMLVKAQSLVHRNASMENLTEEERKP